MVPVILYISKDKETTTKEIHRQMCKFLVEIKISLVPSVRMDAGLLSEIDQNLVLKISRDHEGETFCLTCCESTAFVQILHIRSIFTDQRQRDSLIAIVAVACRAVRCGAVRLQCSASMPACPAIGEADRPRQGARAASHDRRARSIACTASQSARTNR